MDILFLLVPLSVVLVLAIIGVFAWALWGGQFDNVEREGERILWDDLPPPDAHTPGRVDSDQAGKKPHDQQ